jgi:hypothetical protein
MKRMVRFGLAACVCLLGLAPTTQAGRVGGPWSDRGVVRAGHTMSYDNVTYHGGRKANVAISGNGPMRLDVYDAQGRLVVSRNTHPGPQGWECEVFWTPERTAPFTIKVVNVSVYDPHYNYDVIYGIAGN